MDDFLEPEQQPQYTTERFSRGRTKLWVALTHILMVGAGYAYLFLSDRFDYMSVPLWLMFAAVSALPWLILKGEADKMVLLGVRGLMPYIILFFLGIIGINRVLPGGNLMYAAGMAVAGLTAYMMTLNFIDNLDPEDPLSLEE